MAKRIINLTIGNVEVCADEIVGIETESDNTATLVMDRGARINTGVSKWETIEILLEFGYVAEHYRDELEARRGRN